VKQSLQTHYIDISIINICIIVIIIISSSKHGQTVNSQRMMNAALSQD